MDTFDKLNAIRGFIANRASEGAAYAKSWGDEFRSKEVDEAWHVRSQDCELITPVDDILALSHEQLLQLGFAQWDDESGLYLIPIWAWNYVQDGAVLTSISGNVKTKGSDDIDLDTRGGCIAYGFKRAL